MSTPTYIVPRDPPVTGGITLALTLDASPDNPVVGDLDLSDGQIHLWGGAEARRQKIRMVLLFGKGEWWLNPDEGIPYFGSVIGNKNKAPVLAIFRQAFLKALPDLANIQELSLVFDPETRTATVSFDLRFDDGTVIRSADFKPLELRV